MAHILTLTNDIEPFHRERTCVASGLKCIGQLSQKCANVGAAEWPLSSTPSVVHGIHE